MSLETRLKRLEDAVTPHRDYHVVLIHEGEETKAVLQEYERTNSLTVHPTDTVVYITTQIPKTNL